jgi:thiosulfate/3-mercaptopyruvate sulfurtransferase
MPVSLDTSEKFADYAHPERLVSTEWLAEHLDDPQVVVVESDEDVLLYETGHIPGSGQGRLARRPQRPAGA